MPRRRTTSDLSGPADPLGAHPPMPSKANLSEADVAALERHAEELDEKLFGAEVHQTLDEQTVEIRATIEHIFAKG